MTTAGTQGNMHRQKLTHISDDHRPNMVDVGRKAVTPRTAVARASVHLPDTVMALLDGDEIAGPKGPVFQTAIVAGTMACKKTSDLIPLCHPVAIEHCAITIRTVDDNEVHIECSVSIHHKTGVEMEALTGVTVTALTIYDMCKALSHDIVIRDIRLLEKHGGKEDYVRH